MFDKNIKQLVKQIYKILFKEKQKGSLLISIKHPIKRASALTGLSESCIRSWIAKDEEEEPKQSKSDSRKVQNFKTLDNFNIDLILRVIKNMFEKKEPIFIRKLMKTLEEEHGLVVKKVTLWKVMKSKGFHFRKYTGNRSILCERPDLQISRCKYLRDVKMARDSDMNLVYLDETWINANHTHTKEWVADDGNLGRVIPTGRGQRLILLNAVDRVSGFLPGCKLLYKSHSTDGRDFHSEMNSEIFEDWVEHNLLPALTQPSCVIMDNASYHSRICPDTKVPTLSSRKTEMTAWLEKHNIPFNKDLLKPELYRIILQNKPEKKRIVDEMILSHGHLILRLPPYHCDLNPIELLWGIIKNDIGQRNSSFKLTEMRKLADQAMNRISLQTIQSTFKHIEGIESTYWKKDGLSISPTVNPCIISLQDSSSDSEIYHSSDSDQD